MVLKVAHLDLLTIVVTAQVGLVCQAEVEQLMLCQQAVMCK